MSDNSYIVDFLLKDRQNVVPIPTADPVEIAKNACALANTQGGTMLIGVNNLGELVGVGLKEATDIINKCLINNVHPTLPFTIGHSEKEGKNIAIVSVWEGPNKPYVANGAFYIRKEDTTVAASSDEMIGLFEEKYSLDEGWERRTQVSASIDDLDSVAISKIRNVLLRKDGKYATASEVEIMRTMGFVKDQSFTNAGVVVMSKQPSIFIPQTRIRVSVFTTDNGQASLADVRLYDISLISAVDEVVAYLYNLYPKRVVIEGMLRSDVESLPLLALREGILNAVVHRSYESHQSFVAINAYSDYLEIVNSGNLMDGVTLDGLKSVHRSVLRNPDIANAFYQLRYIEMVGSGTLRIIESCRQNRCEEPVWTLANNCVILTFPNVHHNLQPLKEKKSVDVSNLTTDNSVKVSLTAIMDYLATHDHVKLNELTELTGKSYPSVKRYMRILKDASLIEYLGNLRSGGWALSNSVSTSRHSRPLDDPNDSPNDDLNGDPNDDPNDDPNSDPNGNPNGVPNGDPNI